MPAEFYPVDTEYFAQPEVKSYMCCGNAAWIIYSFASLPLFLLPAYLHGLFTVLPHLLCFYSPSLVFLCVLLVVRFYSLCDGAFWPCR